MRRIVFLSIIILAAVIRFYSLSAYPVSLYWDEAAQGYNAYSIVMTGKDEYGINFPLLFRSFDDNKMPLYIYLTAVTIKFFGLNEFSTRFVSALAGTFTVGFVILLTKNILETGEYRKKEQIIPISLICGLLLSISPWHINFSRGAFEANLALFFLVLGTYFFIKSLQGVLYLYISAVAFILAFYSYRSVLVFLPFFIIFSLIIFNRNFRKKIIHLIFFLGIITIFVSPLFVSIFFISTDKRASQVSIFNNYNQLLYQNSIKQNEEGNTIWARFKYNRRITYSYIAMNNYLSHFSPSFLFLRGDGNGRHSIDGMGMMYIFEAPFFIIGLFILHRNLKDKRLFWFILLWLAVSPLPASLTQPAPHALRSLNMLPIPQVLISSGLIYLYYLFKGYQKVIFSSCMVLLIVISFSVFTNKYKSHMISAGNEWGDGYKQLVDEVKKRYSDYDKIVITGDNWEPYIYFLYYTNYNPVLYQKNGDSTGFDKYIFGGTSWDKNKNRPTIQQLDIHSLLKQSKTLLILTTSEYNNLNTKFHKIGEIKNHNNETVYIISEKI